MAFLTHYTDPKKKVLPIVEIVCAIIAIVAAVFLIPPARERHKIYQQAVALHEQGHERIHANDLEGARECFEAALRLDSKLEDSYMELASLHYFEQEFEKERAMYHRGLKELPESTNLRFHLAESLFLSGASSGDLTVFNVKTKFRQIHQIPFDGLAVGGHTVPGPQDLADFPLGEAVILVGILPENIQNIENQQLFGLLCIHLYPPLFFCMIACRLPGDKRFCLITENRFQETKPMTRRSGFRI